MTNIECLEVLRAEVKPYVGIMKRSRYRTIASRIKNGKTVTVKTTEKFFKDFRFEGQYNSWNGRQEGLPPKKLIELEPIPRRYRW